jgi:hypothetical protein
MTMMEERKREDGRETGNRKSEKGKRWKREDRRRKI